MVFFTNSNTLEIHVKFGFSEKATKFEKIFVVILTRASCSVRATGYLSKSRQRFFSKNVDKSYYTNFNKPHRSGVRTASKLKNLYKKIEKLQSHSIYVRHIL